MIIVLKQHAPADKVEAFCKELNGMGIRSMIPSAAIPTFWA